jgi:hypothetical protein
MCPIVNSTVAPVGAPPVKLDAVYSIELRMVFDWRYYQ